MAEREIERVLKDIAGDVNAEIDYPFWGDSDQEAAELLNCSLDYPELFNDHEHAEMEQQIKHMEMSAKDLEAVDECEQEDDCKTEEADEVVWLPITPPPSQP